MESLEGHSNCRRRRFQYLQAHASAFRHRLYENKGEEKLWLTASL